MNWKSRKTETTYNCLGLCFTFVKEHLGILEYFALIFGHLCLDWVLQSISQSWCSKATPIWQYAFNKSHDQGKIWPPHLYYNVNKYNSNSTIASSEENNKTFKLEEEDTGNL